jgi:mannan endo-1,4-beta-mannosidase
VRTLWLNLSTASLTVAILAVLALPAIDVHHRLVTPPRLPVPETRSFAVYVDPWHIDDWAASIGAQPTVAAKFEAFARKRTVETFSAEAQRRGIRCILISWEPWKPVPARLGIFRQSYPQRGYRNVDIAHGAQDEYIRRFARQLSSFKGTVYLRYAHEMNGFWYPWSWDARDYRAAWQRIVRIFRSAGADNVRFVWSINPNLYEGPDSWLQNLKLYWPGRAYVDAIGSTMINFGGDKRYAVKRFAPRLRTLHALYRRPIILTEVNTQYGGRVQWLRSLRALLHRSPWITGVAWSQLPSRGEAQMVGPGDMNWDAQRDVRAAAVLRGIVDDGLGPTP